MNELNVYGYIVAGVVSPMVFAWVIRSLKLIPGVIKDYFKAIKGMLFKPLQNVA